jgi:2-polyprenyl-3-methyl-5-hydroxy-6-metoxy-1,4-benzoquinol methylase
MNKSDFTVYEENYNQIPFEPIMIEYRRKAVIINISKYKHNKILEIGCGNDPIFNFFSDYTKMTVVEPCKSFYDNAYQCKNRDSITIHNNVFENASALLSGEEFDFIIISCLLHEIKDTSLFLTNLHGICNPSTTIHVSVPNANSFHRLLAMEMGIISDQYESSVMNKLMKQKIFSLKSLSEKMILHDFKIIDSGSYFIKPFTHVQMQQLVDSKIIKRTLLDGLDRISKYMPDLGSEVFVNCRIRKQKKISNDQISRP